MLDALKNLGSSGNKPTRQQSDELQALIASSREERAALSTMLTQIQLHSAKLATAGKTLAEVEEKATHAHTRLDEVTERLSKADARARELEAIDARIRGLMESVAQAERETGRLTAPDGELQKQKDSIESLAAQASATRGSLEDAEEGPGGARTVAGAPARIAGGAPEVARACRRAQRAVRRTAEALRKPVAGVREAAGRVARDTRGNHRHGGNGRGGRKKARLAHRIPGDESHDRRAAGDTQRARRTRYAENQGAREPETHRRARRRRVQPAQRDDLEHGCPDHEAERGGAAGDACRGVDRPGRKPVARRVRSARQRHQRARQLHDGPRETRTGSDEPHRLRSRIRRAHGNRAQSLRVLRPACRQPSGVARPGGTGDGSARLARGAGGVSRSAGRSAVHPDSGHDCRRGGSAAQAGLARRLAGIAWQG